MVGVNRYNIISNYKLIQMLEHSLFSHQEDRTVAFFDRFDKVLIKEEIVAHLTEYPLDTIEHCREYPKGEIGRYYGRQIINFYKCNKEGQPCKVVFKGNKEYLKKLT